MILRIFKFQSAKLLRFEVFQMQKLRQRLEHTLFIWDVIQTSKSEGVGRMRRGRKKSQLGMQNLAICYYVKLGLSPAVVFFKFLYFLKYET